MRWWRPREPGRADVHARPQPDRLEALEDRDVLRRVGGLSCLSHRKKPCKTGVLRPATTVYQRGRSAARPGEARKAALFAQFRARPRARSRRRARPPLAPARRLGRSTCGARPARAPARERAGREAELGAAVEPLRRSRPRAVAELEGPDGVGRADVQRPVAARSAPATRCARSRRRPSPASARRRRRAPPAGRTGTARARIVRQPACPCVTSTTCAGSTSAAPSGSARPSP